MKSIFAALLTCASAGVWAGDYVFEYTATITSMFRSDYAERTYFDVSEAMFPGGLVKVGDTVTGSFVIHTSDWTFYPGKTPSYRDIYYFTDGPSANIGSELTFQPRHIFDYGHAVGSEWFGYDVGGWNNYIDDSDPAAEWETSARIDFGPDPDQDTTNDPLGELTPRFAAEYGFFRYSHTTRPKTVGASGALTSLRLISPVPEPSTYVMLLSGFGLLAWRRKRISNFKVF